MRGFVRFRGHADHVAQLVPLPLLTARFPRGVWVVGMSTVIGRDVERGEVARRFLG